MACQNKSNVPCPLVIKAYLFHFYFAQYFTLRIYIYHGIHAAEQTISLLWPTIV